MNGIEHNPIRITVLLQELQEQDLIDEYGNINEIELIETYGELEADNILKTIPYNKIFETIDLDKLYERAITCVQDIRLDLIRHRVHIEDAKELLSLYETIYAKEKGVEECPRE